MELIGDYKLENENIKIILKEINYFDLSGISKSNLNEEEFTPGVIDFTNKYKKKRNSRNILKFHLVYLR
ncbi:MAG TPA: hypothetical protein PKY56_13840 [Candidatus Kapabacteria bacterium]|nr:hypothetical protein [Candidatus Kapabacteria bacterium]